MGSCLGFEGQAPEPLRSNSIRSKLPSKAWTKLSAELDADGVEVDGDSRARVDALVASTMSFFFFFSTGGQVVDDEARPFSPNALLNFPSYLLSSHCSRLLASLSVCLVCLFIKRKITQDEVLPRHHDVRQSPRDDGEDIRLGLPNNRKQVLGREECLVVPFAGRDFE